MIYLQLPRFNDTFDADNHLLPSDETLIDHLYDKDIKEVKVRTFSFNRYLIPLLSINK